MPIAIKRRHCNNTAELQMAIEEIMHLSRASSAGSPHFPRFLDSLVSDVIEAGERMFSVHIMQELIMGGDLLAKLRASSTDLSKLPLARWCLELCDAVGHLHRLDIVHRDIKLENILLRDDATMTLVLCDFGSAVTTASRAGSAFDVVGSTFYLAPELLNAPRGSVRPSRAADAWAVGVTMLEIGSGSIIEKQSVALGEVAFATIDCEDRTSIWHKVLGASIAALQPQARPHADLIRALLRVEPTARLDLLRVDSATQHHERQRERTPSPSVNLFSSPTPSALDLNEDFLAWARKRPYITPAMVSELEDNRIFDLDSLYGLLEAMAVDSASSDGAVEVAFRQLFDDAKSKF
jgi:serine/threonine protein kinase